MCGSKQRVRMESRTLPALDVVLDLQGGCRLIMTLVMLGGLVLLGSLVVLVVCSGINDHFYTRLQPSVETSPLEADTRQFPISDLAIN